MKTAGVILLVLGAGALGLCAAWRMRHRARELRELEQSMELLRCCLERFCLSTQELAHELSQSASGAGADLFQRLERELQASDGRDVAALWQTAAAPLDSASRRALTDFGAVFGRFGASEQAEAARRVRESLGRLAEAAEERAKRGGKLSAVLGFSVGILLALALV